MTDSVGDKRHGLWTAAIGVIFAALLTWPMLLNHGPFLFADTTTYVRGADGAVAYVTGSRTVWSNELARYQRHAVPGKAHAAAPAAAAPADEPDRVVLSGRSIYYGMFAYLSRLVAGFWPLGLAQCAFAAAAAVLAARRVIGREAGPARLAVVLALPLVTAIGYFCGFVMPDIFLALGLLGTAMIAIWWRRDGPAERTFWVAAVATSLFFHSANILVIGALAALIAAARLSGRCPGLNPAPVIAVLLLAIAGEAAFSIGVRQATGYGPTRPPFLMARLIDDGPGTRYLRRACPAGADLLVCRALPRLPMNSDVFLWSQDGVFSALPAAGQRRLAAEQSRFVLAVLRAEPAAVAESSLRSFADQLGRTGLREFAHPVVPRAKLPPELRRSFADTSAAHGRMPVSWIAGLTPAITLASIAAIAALLWRRRHAGGWFRDRLAIVVLIAGGIVLNALVTGALSTPHDRYQSRLLWLLPLLALSLAAAVRPRLATEGEAVAEPDPDRPHPAGAIAA